MNTRWTIAAVISLCAVFAGRLNGAEPLRMQVTPPVSRAPGFLTVRAMIQPAAENRSLQIVAESSGFYRSSEIQIDGRHAVALSVFEFRNLPTGLYQVTGVLVGAHGPRATVLRLAKVEPSTGSVR